MSSSTTVQTTTTTTEPPPSTVLEPPSTTPAMNSDESMKLTIGMALLRSKLLSQPQQHSLSTSNALRWKLKAKDRKKEVLRLKDELKHLEDDLRGDLYPQNACCKCYFFNDLEGLSPKQLKHGVDHRFTDVLRRRFLRLVRSQKRIKKSMSNLIDRQSFAELYREEETEQLKLSAEFLVDLCEASNLAKTPHYASLTHQAVDFILGSLNHGIPVGKEAAVIEGIISSLIVCLVKRMSTPLEDGLFEEWTGSFLHARNILQSLEHRSVIYALYMDRVTGELAKQVGQISFVQKINQDIIDNLFI